MADYNDRPLPPARNVPAPEGWRAADQFDPFEAAMGPYFERWVEGAREFAFIIDGRHPNAYLQQFAIGLKGDERVQ